MDNEKALIWTQIVTGVAVVIGLTLVIWELDQSRRATVAQVTFDSFLLASQNTAAALGEDAADVLAKACANPKELTAGDWVVLDKYYRSQLGVGGSLRYVEGLGFGDQGAGDFVQTGTFGEIFSTAPGRGWFVTNVQKLRDETAKLGEALLEKAGPVSCAAEFRSYATEAAKYLD